MGMSGMKGHLRGQFSCRVGFLVFGIGDASYRNAKILEHTLGSQSGTNHIFKSAHGCILII